MRWNGLLLTAIGVLLATASPASAVTFNVTGNGDGSGICDGGVSGGNCTTIRAALVTARETPGTEQDIINVPAGTYRLTAGPLQIGSSVSLRGAGARTTTIAASPDARVIEIQSTAAAVSYLTVTGGVAYTSPHGGNISADNSNVDLDHVRVTNGRAYSGGGIANRNGHMTIENSLIDNNRAPDGGGDGGGIINFGGDGGGPATLVIRDSTVAFNHARLAGAIISYPNALNSVALESATIAYNAADENGTRGVGGIQVSPDSGSFFSRGSLIADNVNADGSTQNCAQTMPTSEGSNVESDSDCGFSESSDRTNADPDLATALANLGGETDVLAFGAASPARDIGGTCSLTDQTDAVRPQGLGCDAGAWEFTVAVTQPPTPTPTPTPTPPTATPVPTPAATPTATPVAGKSVGVKKISGKVLVKLPNSKGFVELDPSVIPNGSEVDTRYGVVEITRSDGGKAKFYDGIFKLSQSGGFTILTLTEKLDCKKAGKKASAAAKKPKTRKLWGDGKGKFRTRGQYSAATIRGTKWLVQDTCTSTITKVLEGVVSVRDEVKKKTIVLRKGKSYTARPARR